MSGGVRRAEAAGKKSALVEQVSEVGFVKGFVSDEKENWICCETGNQWRF